VVLIKNENEEKLINVLTPNIIQERLINISMFITVYEWVTDYLITTVKDFYLSGCKNGKNIYDGYEENVINKASGKGGRQWRGTLLWLLGNGAILQTDIAALREITDVRNDIVHKMLSYLYSGPIERLDEHQITLINLAQKVSKWLFKEVEMPTSGQYTPEDYDKINFEDIENMGIEWLRMIRGAAINSDSKYMQELIKIIKQQRAEKL
jgi:hypothetical protein